MERKTDNDTLTRSLNALLASLEIPLVLQTPLELTPSLILTIFESMLRTSLPISAETKKCRTYAARVEAMKIFIGVLEDDVLGIDVGLGDIDPRRLADGRRQEVLRVVETLCWLGRRMNYLSQDGLSVGNVAKSRDYSSDGAESSSATERPASPSVFSAVSASHDSSLLAHSTLSIDDSQTTVTAHEELDDESQGPLDEEEFSILAPSPIHRSERRDFMFSERAHQHEVAEDSDATAESHVFRQPLRRYDFDSGEESDIDDSDAYCHCDPELPSSSSIIPPIRTTGYLDTVDFEEELRMYELQRRSKSSDPRQRNGSTSYLSDSQPRTPRSSCGIITRHTSPAQYTLALLEERARLLSELSRLRQGHDTLR